MPSPRKPATLQTVPIGDIVEHPANPRQGDVGAICESIEANGWFGVVTVQRSSGHILDGNHRHRAMTMLGRDKIGVSWVDVDDATALRILLAANRTGDLATYDDPVLADILQSIAANDTLVGTGWDGDDLDDLLADMDRGVDLDEDSDVVPDPPATPITRLGDLVLLGDHRLSCGDSLELLPQLDFDVIVTDPPYGIGYRLEPQMVGTGNRRRMRGGGQPIVGDDQPFDPAHLLAFGYPTVMFGANHYADRLPPVRGWLVWDKTGGGRGPKDTFADVEMAWTNLNTQPAIFHHLWKGLVRDSEAGEKTKHPTQKPVALMSWVIDKCPAGIVCDPYAGSGTTLIAAEQTGRICHAIEIDPAYCDVIIKRWENHTGQTATRPDPQTGR